MKIKMIEITIIAIVSMLLLSLSSFGQEFTHPGIMNNKTELDLIKQKINNGEQPWLNAFNALKASEFAALTYQASPFSLVECGSYNKPNIGCNQIVEDGMAVYAHALIWYFTDDVRYANKSKEIMSAWSYKYQQNTNSNARLVVAWAAPFYVNGAEIIRHSNIYWNTADVNSFNGMLTKFITYLTADEAPLNNWILSRIEAHMAIAIFKDDRTAFNTAVERWKKYTRNYIYQTTDGAKPGWATAPINGFAMETCRDLGHLSLGIRSSLNAAQIAYQQGVDLFSLERKRLADTLELHGSWTTGSVAVPANVCGGTVITSPANPVGISPPIGGGSATYEIASRHLVERLKMNLPYTTQMNKHNLFSAGGWVTKWETLTQYIPDTTPVGPAGYRYATYENTNVFVSGTMNVAYGANGQFVYLYNRTTDVACTNSAFNKDPIVGVQKNCFVQSVPPKSSSANTQSSIAKSSIAKSSQPNSSRATSSVAIAGGSCKYIITSEWNTGYTATIRITNTGTNVINGWNVNWAYSDGSKITSSWNTTLTGTNPYSATNISWNGTIQSGQFVELGFQVNKSSSVSPQIPVVTGSVCK
jgi:hypothetical protein